MIIKYYFFDKIDYYDSYKSNIMSYTELSKRFYEEEYKSFSDSRFCLWDSVKEFCDLFNKQDYVLDAGCGNGKNISYYQTKCNIIGIDLSKNLVNICKERGYTVDVGNITNTEFKDNTFDYIISIAVIHHIEHETERIKTIRELVRILKPNGKLLVTLWAYEGDIYSKKKKFKIGDNIIPFGKSKHQRYYYVYDQSSCVNFCDKCDYPYEIKWERGNWILIFTKK